uniref:Uncharacterized protein n=1 Tax=viral metagenome TaxID=1070528 RepID=A0A6C0EKM6_9ZZZZ
MGKYSENDIIKGTEQVLKNGMLAGKIMIDGRAQFRIVGLVDKAAHARSVKARRPGRASQQLSPRGAARAFNRHYSTSPKYKNEKSRKGAKSRDLCWDNQPTVTDRRYSRSPHLYDYPGRDDGSRCENVHKYKSGYSPKRMQKGSPEALAWGQKMKAKKGLAGGGVGVGGGEGGGARPVSLKTAVRLLRQYYDEKYH